MADEKPTDAAIPGVRKMGEQGEDAAPVIPDQQPEQPVLQDRRRPK